MSPANLSGLDVQKNRLTTTLETAGSILAGAKEAMRTTTICRSDQIETFQPIQGPFRPPSFRSPAHTRVLASSATSAQQPSSRRGRGPGDLLFRFRNILQRMGSGNGSPAKMFFRLSSGAPHSSIKMAPKVPRHE